LAPCGVCEELTSARWAETATHFVAALGRACVFREPALDFDFVGREHCVGRSVASEVLAVLTPAYARCHRLGTNLKADLAAQATTKILIHGLQCFRIVRWRTVGSLCGLTFELSGPRREGAWPARRMMALAGSRAKRLAGGGPLERRVRPHSPSWRSAFRLPLQPRHRGCVR
jgi:hypothetical protein